MARMSSDDPTALNIFKIAWKQALNELSKPPRVSMGPTTEEEYLALVTVLDDLAAAVEVNLLAAMEQAATIFHVSHADIGRACGISRQAVRQRLVRAKRKAERRNDDWVEWEETTAYRAENYEADD
jgi:DNA-directed RNA polymerase specialized sigma24 family protein